MTAILFLHGGGHADHTRYTRLIERFSESGILSHAFDHHATTLTGRLVEAEKELEILKARYNLADADIFIWGSSMGGHVAAKLTTSHPNLAGVILQSAAAYSKAAENIPFGPDFTAEIRKEGSWQDSLSFDSLDKYAGRVLVVYGENDDVIPSGVMDRYIAKAVRNGEHHQLKNVGHSLLRPQNTAAWNAWEQMLILSVSFINKTVN